MAAHLIKAYSRDLGCGVFQGLRFMRTARDQPDFFLAVAEMGNMGAVWESVRYRNGRFGRVESAGAGITPAAALLPSFGEAFERYCTLAYRKEQFTWASADELCGTALNLESIPRCSQLELAHPKCAVTAIRPYDSIRWTEGTSLIDGKLIHIPAIMVYSHLPYESPKERFWLPISTGCAAAETFEEAALTGFYEVIERDALSIMWLQKMPLPEIIIDDVPTTLAETWEAYLRSSRDISFRFFDATSDFNVPTVLGLSVSIKSRRVTHLVSCATGASITRAMAKALKDLSVLRIAFDVDRQLPDTWDDYTDLFHGATYMARAASAPAFNFLLDDPPIRKLSEYHCTQAPTLRDFLHVCSSLGVTPIAVDLTTDEALRVGVKVVRAVIPELQPISFRYRSRFLGNPRLYTLPQQLGYVALPEPDLNPWPLPFA